MTDIYPQRIRRIVQRQKIRHKTCEQGLYVNVDSVDVARLLMADPQEQVWSVGVTWTKSTCVKEVARITYPHEHVRMYLA